MYRIAGIVLGVTLCTWVAQSVPARPPGPEDQNEPASPRISLTKLEVNQEGLALQFEITNDSTSDVWICDDMNMKGKWHFEALLDDGYHRTLIVRRRLDVPAGPLPFITASGHQPGHPVATYVRLEPGGRRAESLLLESPVQCRRILSRARPTKTTVHVQRLLVQIGFYLGDLPAMIRDVLAKAEQSWETYAGYFAPGESQAIEAVDLWKLNTLNKKLDDTTDVVAIPYTSQTLKGERIVEIAVDGVTIPYQETADSDEVLEGYSAGSLGEPQQTAGVDTRVEVGPGSRTWRLPEPPRAMSDHDMTVGTDAGESVKRQPSLHITALEVADNQLDLRYDVRNNSEHPIWLCDDVDVGSPVDFETIASLNGSTLVIRLRLDIPMGWWRQLPPAGRYVGLAPGEHYGASLRLALPVRQQPVLAGRSAHHPEQEEQANRLALEVGYFPGDLAATVASLLHDANEVEHLRQNEEERLFRAKRRLTREYEELSKKRENAVNSTDREDLQRRLDELDAQIKRTHEAWLSAYEYPLSLYLENLDLEIPTELLLAFRDIDAKIHVGKNEIIIPHEYPLDVETEHFLRAVLEDVQVPHLPPRYLDLTESLPWRKTRLDKEPTKGGSSHHLSPIATVYASR